MTCRLFCSRSLNILWAGVKCGGEQLCDVALPGCSRGRLNSKGRLLPHCRLQNRFTLLLLWYAFNENLFVEVANWWVNGVNVPSGSLPIFGVQCLTCLTDRNPVCGPNAPPVVPEIVVQVRVLGQRVHHLRGKPSHHGLEQRDGTHIRLRVES